MWIGDGRSGENWAAGCGRLALPLGSIGPVRAAIPRLW
jgi:hypothetical protein